MPSALTTPAEALEKWVCHARRMDQPHPYRLWGGEPKLEQRAGDAICIDHPTGALELGI